jgi:hypothetical protein
VRGVFVRAADPRAFRAWAGDGARDLGGGLFQVVDWDTLRLLAATEALRAERGLPPLAEEGET